MRNRGLVCFLLLLIAFSAAVASAQDWKGRGRTSGIVTDPDKKPVDGAKVTLLLRGEAGQGPPPVVTDKKGRWAVGGLTTGDWTVLIDKEGFKGLEASVHVVAESIAPAPPIQVTLAPIPKQSAEASQQNTAAAMVERGNALLMEQKWADARKEYQSALGLLEDKTYHPAILRAITKTYYEEGQKGEAMKTLDQALALNPDDQDSLKLMVTLLMAEGKETEAKAYQARITTDFKVDPNSLLNLGIQKYNANQMADALPYFDRVVQENPSLGDGYYYRGLTYLALNKIPEAKADFQKMLEVDPGHAKAGEVRDMLGAL
ncbi:MAG: tetratricopeptide repeat protein [Thermoanaerobaculia bacterium]